MLLAVPVLAVAGFSAGCRGSVRPSNLACPSWSG